MMNYRIHSVVLVTLGALFLTGCWPFASNNGVEKNEEPKLFVINVLDKGDYDDCHITGSIHIDFDEFEAAIKTLNKNNYYVVYCADYMCMSSSFCAKLLKDAGFMHVWAYEGGMAEWYQKGYPYQGSAEMDYLKAESLRSEDEEAISDVPTITAEQLLEKMQEFGVGQ